MVAALLIETKEEEDEVMLVARDSITTVMLMALLNYNRRQFVLLSSLMTMVRKMLFSFH